jgi:hypothetical protein
MPTVHNGGPFSLGSAFGSPLEGQLSLLPEATMNLLTAWSA